MPSYTYVLFVVELFTLVTGIYFFRQLKSKLLYLFVFVCIGFSTEISQALLYQLGFHNNMWLSHVYFPLEFFLLTQLYVIHFKNSKLKKWTRIVSFVFMAYCVANPFVFQSLKEYSQVRSFSCVLLVLFSILYYHQVMVEAKIRKLSADPMIWINSSVLLYFSGSLFYNLLFSLILERSREFSKLTTLFFGVLTMVFYLLIAIGFWKAGRQKVVSEK